MSNSLDPDQDRHSVGPDLGPNCLQRSSADDKSPRLTYLLMLMSKSAVTGSVILVPNISKVRLYHREVQRCHPLHWLTAYFTNTEGTRIKPVLKTSNIGGPPVKYFTDRSKAILLLWIFYVFSVLCLLCLCTRLFICALWSTAGKGLTSWLSFVVSNCEFVTFPLVSWVRSGT